MVKLPIYLDHHATTPCDPAVVEAMVPYFSTHFGNASSRNHSFGWEAEKAVNEGREEVASIIHADPREIVFTSGATESNNLALKGVAAFAKGRRGHLISVQSEHRAVLDPCRKLQREGFDVTFLSVDRLGKIDLEEFTKAIQPSTILVSVMMANNEVGTLHPIAEIGRICKHRGILFHTDATQAVGKIPVDVDELQVDLLSFSAHKMYGPKGVGALYVRRRNPHVRLEPLFDGGGHERGMRSGTLAVPLIVGFAVACRISKNAMGTEGTRLASLRDDLERRIRSRVPEVYVNGDPDARLPGNLNLSFAGVQGEALLMGIKNVALSSGSACTSASVEPSYVLRAMGLSDDLAHASIRFGIGRFNTAEEIEFVAEEIARNVERLRNLNPMQNFPVPVASLRS